jgi:hypothetical protein
MTEQRKGQDEREREREREREGKKRAITRRVVSFLSRGARKINAKKKKKKKEGYEDKG